MFLSMGLSECKVICCLIIFYKTGYFAEYFFYFYKNFEIILYNFAHMFKKRLW